MQEFTTDIEALAHAVQVLTKTTESMEEAYRRLESRVLELDRELEEKNHELAITSEYLSSLLESMNDGVVAVNMEDCIVRFNRAATTILGYSGDEVVGKSFESVFDRSFFSGTKLPAQSLRAKSGRRVPVSERDSPVTDGTNRRLGWVKTFQDLSELHALREQLRQMDRLAALGEMAATVAHEIRNPLGGIRGFASLLAQDIPEPDPRNRLVNKILTGTHTLDKVVTGLLEYTRPVELSLRPVGCLEILQGALSYLEYDKNKTPVHLSVSPGCRILADPDKLRQVFLNILINAIQSIENSGEITVDAETEETIIHIHFRDTGTGLSEEQQEKMFSPFYTTREKGTGLGLAVCAKIVEGHGGRICAKNATDDAHGAVITVTLPRSE